MRHVVVHHHILKNAGTSVDAALRTSFGALWREYDPVDTLGHDAAAVHILPFLAEQPALRAISSHVFRPSRVESEELSIYPIVFLRDPILRAASVYWFLRRTPGSDPQHWLARKFTFKEFVDIEIVGSKHSHIRNHQARVLSGFATCCAEHHERPEAGETFARATSFLRTLPAFGIVERFNDSLAWLASWLRPVFPEIAWVAAHEHAGEHTMTTRQAIRAELGADTYEKLVALNRDDIRLYEEALKRFDDHHGLRMRNSSS